jgi:hypothetical protein
MENGRCWIHFLAAKERKERKDERALSIGLVHTRHHLKSELQSSSLCSLRSFAAKKSSCWA